MFKATGVLDILGKGLAPPNYGSYSYKLMVYPDIDCDIVSKSQPRISGTNYCQAY
ncbi:MAG: hypothetical protein U0491_00610 [Candidatus Saccharimonadales bacterium]